MPGYPILGDNKFLSLPSSTTEKEMSGLIWLHQALEAGIFHIAFLAIVDNVRESKLLKLGSRQEGELCSGFRLKPKQLCHIGHN